MTTSAKLFLDCEFNETRGFLISMALVPLDERLPEFYAIDRSVYERPVTSWVRENVVPLLLEEIAGGYGSPLMSRQDLRTRLSAYLWGVYTRCGNQPLEIVVDWAADPIYLFDLILDPYNGAEMLSVPPFDVLLRTGLPKEPSLHPHNALSDARAMARAARKAQ